MIQYETQYDEVTMTASVTIIDTKKHKRFTAKAQCDPSDKDMASEHTGLEIATRRAQIKLYEDYRETAQTKVSILYHLIDCMKRSKKYNPHSYEAQMLRRQLKIQEEEKKIIEDLIKMEKIDLENYIKEKDEFYKSVRKLREKQDKNK